MNKDHAFKFGLIGDDRFMGFAFQDIFQVEERNKSARLKIGAKSGQVDLILDWASEHQGPFGMLYVLTLSHRGHELGRYQNATPCDHEQLRFFLSRFREFFEYDGRHHIWVTDLETEDQLVYDNHQIIFAYGHLDKCRSLLWRRGFTEESVTVPDPHSHFFNPEYDATEDEVLEYWEWKMFPLVDAQDDA